MARQTRASRREYWREVIRRQQASGLSIQRFCQQEPVATATFYAWKRKFQQEHPGPPKPVRPVVGFAPVRIVPESPGLASGGALEIVLGRDRRIRLVGAVDKTMLADVLAVLEGPAC